MLPIVPAINKTRLNSICLGLERRDWKTAFVSRGTKLSVAPHALCLAGKIYRLLPSNCHQIFMIGRMLYRHRWWRVDPHPCSLLRIGGTERDVWPLHPKSRALGRSHLHRHRQGPCHDLRRRCSDHVCGDGQCRYVLLRCWDRRKHIRNLLARSWLCPSGNPVRTAFAARWQTSKVCCIHAH